MSPSPGAASRDRHIEALPGETASLLRSTLVIPSLPAALLELVHNSVDAGATKVDCSIDLDRWTIKCQDDGCGISPRDLSAVARGAGQRAADQEGDDHGGGRGWTSKSLDRNDSFGFRGEALTSLADLGLLEVLTKTDSDQDGGGESWSVVVRGSDRLFQGKARTPRTLKGTTVWVRDLFYKWPVRRKALGSSSARTSLVNSCRQALETFALLQPSVAFSLVDVSHSSKGTTAESKQIVRVTRTLDGLVGRWRQLWGRSAVEHVKEFNASDLPTEQDPVGRIEARGFFSLAASHSRSQQFVFVNSRPVDPCEIHKIINKAFEQSSFSKHSTSLLGLAAANAETSGRPGSRKSPQKVVERHPIFVMHIRAPSTMVDVTLEPEKRVVEIQDEDRVHTFVRHLVEAFLREEGFSAPASEPRATPALDLATLQVNDGRDRKRPGQTSDVRTEQVSSTCCCDDPAPRPLKRSRALLDATPPVADVEAESEEPLRWYDPQTARVHLVDPRTGNSIRTESGPVGDDNAGNRTRHPVDRSALRRSLSDPAARSAQRTRPQSEFVMKALQTWTNPLFPSSKPSLTALTKFKNDLPAGEMRTAARAQEPNPLGRAHRVAVQSFFETATRTEAVPGALLDDVQRLGQTVSKKSLEDCQFISQVDRKFLLVLFKGDSVETFEQATADCLVLVDQHAASERIRVEKMLEEVCGNVARGVPVSRWYFKDEDKEDDRTRYVIVSTEEAKRITNLEAELASWGIDVRVPDLPSEPDATDAPVTDYVQVQVLSVPLVVSKRLRADARLLQDLVRTFVASKADDGPSTFSTGTNSAVPSDTWYSTLRRCPPTLLELINSKACRGAVMFNDELSNDQCLKMLSILSKTKFPFQCAHGRPSLVPLVNLPRARSSATFADRASESVARTDSQVDWSRWTKPRT